MREELLDQLSNYTKFGHRSVKYVPNDINKIYRHVKGGSSCNVIRNIRTY